MRASLAGNVVLITGPARGIGAETARQLAARGARLALVGLEPARLSALAGELGDLHRWWECDVTDQRALDAAVAGTVRELGAIDVVIANAGIASNGTVAVTPVEALARTVDVNLGGVVRTVSATLPHVSARQGYYLLISSAAAIAPMGGIATYAATKAGVEAFGRALRLELASRGVRVGIALPGWIDTDLVRDTMHDLPSFRRMLRELPGPFGRVTPVEDCARALVSGIERRRRTIYVPASLAPFAAARQLFTTRVVERIVARRTARLLPGIEREVRALGRAFGEHSVEQHRDA